MKLQRIGDGLFWRLTRAEGIDALGNTHGALGRVVRSVRREANTAVITVEINGGYLAVLVPRALELLAQSFYPRSVILTMGRRNRPKQGDPKPLFEDQPSSSKISKRKADDEGRQKNTKKVKPNDSKGKGKQVFARGGLKERKRTKMATPAADDYEDEYSDMDA